MGRVTALLRAVTTVSWMSNGSHEPDVDESLLEPAGPWYQCLRVSSKQTLFAVQVRTGSACWVPLLVRNQMWGLEQRRRAPERAQRPSGHRSATSCAHILPRYEGRSIIGNNEKISQLLPISTYYGLFLLISTYYRPTCFI